MRRKPGALGVRWVAVGIGVLSALACHSTAPSGGEASGRVDAAPGPGRVDAATGSAPVHPQVQLTWRLFETTHALDENGQDRASAVFELLVNGGIPARIELGRRPSFGCAVHDATDDPSIVASLDCYAFAHGEYARVQRPSPGTLQVEAFGQDEALPGLDPPRRAAKAATVTIPADAEIVVEHGVMTIPDEVPSK
jgi:hypothetical protein